MAVFARNLSVPEGPVHMKDGTWLVVEMGPDRGCVTQLDTCGDILRVVAETGRPNGLAIDRHENIWVAESKVPSLIKLTQGGHKEIVSLGTTEKPFLFPNDLCFGPDGKLYMTDSGIQFDDFAPGGQIRSDFLEVELDGRVYVFDPTTGSIQVIDSGLRFPNGIAFGPDGSLYVNETITGLVYLYRWESNQIVGKRQPFGNVLQRISQLSLCGPDGMAFGEDGRLYVSVFGQGDVTVLETDGSVYTRIPTEGKSPTNVAFATGDTRIFVTEDELGQIEVFDVGCTGLGLHL